MSTLVFRTYAPAMTDHCQECGGEEYEGNTGTLRKYLVVDVEDVLGEIKRTSSYGEQDLCEECARRLANA